MSAFKLSVLTDEISQDLEHALDVAAREFDLGYVELRAAWGKNVMAWDAKDVAEARGLLERFRLRVSAIASPLFKADWPGAPLSTATQDRFGADYVFDQQQEVLGRGLELARVFRTDHLRCFDFWRLADPAPHRAAIDRTLADAGRHAGARGITLVLENEFACNTATGAEAARTLKAVDVPFFQLNWDPQNAAWHGETPYPDGYDRLPPKRVAHVHVKDLSRKATGGFEHARVGSGIIDWEGQFRALKRDGYSSFVTLETHWRGAGSAEESTRQSMAGTKEALRRAGAL
jgi:sugar phosphate isomerase/epimerase